MMSRKRLTFGYSTLSERVEKIKFPDLNNEDEIIVVVQNPNQKKFDIINDEIRVFELTSIGVAKSRNEVMRRTDGEFLLFGDDDIEFISEGIEEALQFFSENPDCAIVLAQASDEFGELRKKYPRRMVKLKLTNSAKAATYEMIIRPKAFMSRGIYFDEGFGAGVKNYLGDEYILIADALRAGLKGYFLPLTIARHPRESSGSRFGTPEDLRARSAVFSRVFASAAPLVRLAFLIKSRRWYGIRNSLRFILGR